MQAHITCSAIFAAQQKRQLHACFMHYEHHSLQVQHVLSAPKKGLQSPAAVCTCLHCVKSSRSSNLSGRPAAQGVAGCHVLDTGISTPQHALQAYYVIKAAQEREELQRQGDELDARVRKAERECQGLQAALNKLMGTNLDLNASFR